jgi:hypothetical protein
MSKRNPLPNWLPSWEELTPSERQELRLLPVTLFAFGVLLYFLFMDTP